MVYNKWIKRFFLSGTCRGTVYIIAKSGYVIICHHKGQMTQTKQYGQTFINKHKTIHKKERMKSILWVESNEVISNMVVQLREIIFIQ